MASEKERQIAKEKLEQFIKLAKAKNYSVDTVKSACIIAGSQEMYDNFGDYPQALDKCCELCKKYDDVSKMLEELLKLTKYNSDDR